MSYSKLPNAPLPPEVQDLLLAGIVASIAQQGKLTREMAEQLPGVGRGLTVLTGLMAEED